MERYTTELTPRERECLELLAEGIPTKDIPARMHVSSNTVKSHIMHVREKLGVTTTREAACIWWRGRS
jgi:DNA-binding CsgD family transcriptional regulator